MNKSLEDKSKLPIKNKLAMGAMITLQGAVNTAFKNLHKLKRSYPTGIHGYNHPIKSKLVDDSSNTNGNSMTCARTKMDYIC